MDNQLKILIEKSKALDLNKLQKEVAELITAYPNYGKKTWNIFEPHGLYRARQHNHLEGNFTIESLYQFTSELEFWNTPNQYCKLGRCNDDNESIFYCTNEFEVAEQEIKPDQEYISVSHFRPKPRHFQTSYKTAIPIGVSYLSKLPGLKKFSLYEVDKKYLELDDFLDNLFHLNVEKGYEHLYKLTTAVTRNLMSSIRTRFFDVPMQGLVYPSMARDKKGFNIAFKPEHVVSNYYLYGVQTHKVLENCDKTITIQLIRNGVVEKIRNNINESSDIFWYEPLVNGEIFTFEKKHPQYFLHPFKK